MRIFFSMIISYLLGSIPIVYIYGNVFKGIDKRRHGTGKVGATNVFRVLGKGAGTIVLICDVLKGVLAVAVVPDVFGTTEVIHRVILALVVVTGHNWTVFLNFRGGKGIATSLGALIGLAIRIAVIRPVLLWTVGVWIVCFLATGYVSVSSIASSVFLPLIIAGTNQSIEIICLGVIFCLFVVLRHRPNIKRLLSGQEPRVPLFKKKP